MKSKLIIAWLVCIIMAPPAHAVTKCVALNSNTRCGSSQNNYLNYSDWQASCTSASTINVPILGTSICTAAGGSFVGEASAALGVHYPNQANTYEQCWCRLLSPGVSRWIYAGEGGLMGSCGTSCAALCAYLIQSNSTFRSNMFGSLSD